MGIDPLFGDEEFQDVHRVFTRARAEWFKQNPDAEWHTGADAAGLKAVREFGAERERNWLRGKILEEIERTYTLDQNDEEQRAYVLGKNRALMDVLGFVRGPRPY